MLLSTYVCHPSLANDNLSGIAVAAMLAKRCSARPAALVPVSVRSRDDRATGMADENREALDRIRHGLTLSCIGDGGGLTYKRSRRSDAEVDQAVETVLRDSGARIGCCRGSRGAGTSASSARPASTCRSGR